MKEIDYRLRMSYETQEKEEEQRAISEENKQNTYIYIKRIKDVCYYCQSKTEEGIYTDDSKMSEILKKLHSIKKECTRKQYEFIFSEPLIT